MDTENLLVKCTALTIEVCATWLFYRQYKTHAECLKSLKEAQNLELDTELRKNVENNNGVIKYAAVSGKIQALTPPLRSQYVPYLSGVIREKITIERKVKWNPFLGIWGSANNDLLQTVNSVPFALCGKTFNLFKKKVSVEVVEPLTAQELVIPTVYDKFQCHHDSIGDAVFGVFRGEKTLGIQEIERLLCENETLTAVGKLVIENNKLKIKPPEEDLTYFLTPLSLESLISKVNFTTKVFKVISIVLGTVSLAFFIYFTRLAFVEIKQRIVRQREKKKWEEERRLRRMADKSRKAHDINMPKCIVCLDNPIEIILLECGHLCLCYDCSEHIRNLCPVCRNPIARTVSAFWA